MMEYPIQKLHAISARRQDIILKIARHQRPKPALNHIHYKWASPLPKPQRSHQKIILLDLTGS